MTCHEVLMQGNDATNVEVTCFPRLADLVRLEHSWLESMADALAGAGEVSRTGCSPAPAQIARILQCLGLLGKFLGSHQAWVAA